MAPIVGASSSPFDEDFLLLLLGASPSATSGPLLLALAVVLPESLVAAAAAAALVGSVGSVGSVGLVLAAGFSSAAVSTTSSIAGLALAVFLDFALVSDLLDALLDDLADDFAEAVLAEALPTVLAFGSALDMLCFLI